MWKQIAYSYDSGKVCQLLGTCASFERALPTQFSALHTDVVRPLLESRVSPSFSDLALRRRKEKRRDEWGSKTRRAGTYFSLLLWGFHLNPVEKALPKPLVFLEEQRKFAPGKFATYLTRFLFLEAMHSRADVVGNLVQQKLRSLRMASSPFHYIACDCNSFYFRDEQLRAHWCFSSTRRKKCARQNCEVRIYLLH